jgi:hypothetical protein
MIPPAYPYPNPTLSYPALPCPTLGYYSNSSSSVLCDLCPKGSFVSTDVADDDGIGISSGGTFCVDCPNGRFSATDGASSCTLL